MFSLVLPACITILCLNGSIELSAAETEHDVVIVMLPATTTSAATENAPPVNAVSEKTETLVVVIRMNAASLPIDVQQRGTIDPFSAPLEQQLKRLLDRNDNEELDKNELLQAEELLTRYDFDEDEQLAPLEIQPRLLSEVSQATSPDQQQRSRLLIAHDAETTATLREVLTEHEVDADVVLKAADVVIDLTLGQSEVAQHGQSSDTESPHIAVVKSPTGWVIQKHACRLALHSAGWTTQAQAIADTGEANGLNIQVRPGRLGWFEMLDFNGDSLLSRIELRSAHLLSNLPRAHSEEISFALTLSPNTQPGRRGIRLVNAVEATDFDALPADVRWFAAMDVNGDGVVSSREFLGTTNQFSSFDANHDRLITAAEARALTAKNKSDQTQETK